MLFGCQVCEQSFLTDQILKKHISSRDQCQKEQRQQQHQHQQRQQEEEGQQQMEQQQQQIFIVLLLMFYTFLSANIKHSKE